MEALGNEIIAKNKMQQAVAWHGIALADREWQLNDVAKADEILETCPKEWHFWEWHYLKRLCHKALKVFDVEEVLATLEFSPDGKRLAAAGKDLVMLNTATGAVKSKFLRDWPAKAASISSSPDGRRLAALSQIAKGVSVFDLNSAKEVLTLPVPANLNSTVRFGPDGKHLACGASDGTVRIWQVMNGQEVHRLQGHTGKSVEVAYNGDGKLLASVDHFQKTVTIWDAPKGRQLMSRKLSKRIVRMALSPDGKYVAVLEANALIRVLHTQTGEEYATFGGSFVRPFPTNELASLTFSPDSNLIAIAGLDSQAVTIWNIHTGTKEYTFRGHTNRVISAAFSPDGKRLATLGQDKTVRLWDATSPQEAYRFGSTLSLNYGHFAYSANGERLALHRRKKIRGQRAINEVLVFDKGASAPIATVNQPAWDDISAIGLCPEGRLLAVAYRKGLTIGLKFFDALSGTELKHVFEKNGLTITQLAFSPNGRYLFHSGYQVLEVKTGEVYLHLHGYKHAIRDMKFSPDGDLLVSCDAVDGTLKLWDLPGKKILYSRLAHAEGKQSGTFTVAFSPDGKQMVTGGRDGSLKIWDTSSGKLHSTLVGHPSFVGSLAWSPDGRRIASAGMDQTIKLWDPDSTRELLTLRGPKDAVNSIAFSPTGHWLVASHGGSISFYDATPWGQQPAPLPKVE